MTGDQLSQYQAELLHDYPGAHIKIAEDKAEMVAELDGYRAIAVIERSQPHFHSKTREIYKVLRGTLLVACGGRGYALKPGESVAIEPGDIHFARGVGAPALIEVRCDPAWTIEDYLVL